MGKLVISCLEHGISSPEYHVACPDIGHPAQITEHHQPGTVNGLIPVNFRQSLSEYSKRDVYICHFKRKREV